MNTKDLKCFEAVYQEQSISKAARRLYITPQGLGKNIRTLEAELKTILFERTKQGVRPTESADFLHGRSKKIIQELEELENGVRQLENRKIVLRIGCACGVFKEDTKNYETIQQFDVTVQQSGLSHAFGH